MDQVLDLINRRCISLDDDEIKDSNKLIKEKIEKLLIPKLKEDSLFNTIYNSIAFGGSYYDDLKIGKPDEFDLDFKLTLPKCWNHYKKNCSSCNYITTCLEPGYVNFKVENTLNEKFNERFIKDGYLNNEQVLKKWFKSIVDKALKDIKSKFEKELDMSNAEITEKEVILKNNTINRSESGPAITLKLQAGFGPISIDLVPAFELSFEYISETECFRGNTSDSCKSFLIVPKNIEKHEHWERYWRPSFQEQEKELILDKGKLKPALKLLKKIRSSHNESIFSYALKSIVLRDLENNKDMYTKEKKLSDCFLHLVQLYKDSLNKKIIRYYWNENNNLLSSYKEDTLNNYFNRINSIFSKLELEPSNPYEIAKLILKDGTEEYENVILEMKEKDGIFDISSYDSYKNMERDLNYINTRLKSTDDEIENVKTFIQSELLPELKKANEVFKKMYQKCIFYDSPFIKRNLNVYLVLSVPGCDFCETINCGCDISHSPQNDLLLKKICCKAWDWFTKRGYLDSEQLLGSLWDILNVFLKGNIEYNCQVVYDKRMLYLLMTSESGITHHINVVPALKFNYDSLPESIREYDSLPESIREGEYKDRDKVLIIPRQSANIDDKCNWWPCFYYQEQKLWKNKHHLNPAFKLLKKTIGTLYHEEVSDYALRTILLWDVETNQFNYEKSLGDAFMHILQEYKGHLQRKEIFYFWKKRRNLNLLDSANDLQEYARDVDNIISEIKDSYSTQPEILAKVILGEESEEFEKFKSNMVQSITTTQSEDSVNYHSCYLAANSRLGSDKYVNSITFNSEQCVRSSTIRAQEPYLQERSTQRSSTIRVQETYSQERSPQRSQDNEGNGLIIAAGVVAAVGAAAMIGFGIWGALANSNRSNNRRH